MSDTLGITIKVEAGNAKSEIAGVEQQLAKVEGRGASTGSALTRGMNEGSSAAEKLKGKAREAGEEIGKIEGSFSQAIGSRFGEVGNVLGEFATKGTVAAAGIVGVGAAVVELSDRYAELENQAQRLTGGLQATSDALDQQVEMAGRLHSSLDATMELSIAVKERTDDLNLSQAEQSRLTQSLGEAAALSGKGMQDAAGALDRVGFALQEGIPAGRMMKDIMTQFPPIAEAMKTHFAATGKEIVDMANKGQISLRDFQQAMAGAGEDLDRKMGNRVEGLGTKLGHMKDKLIESKLLLEDFANWVNPGILAMERETAKLNEETDARRRNTEEIMTAVDAVQKLEFENSELVVKLHELADAQAAGTKVLDDASASYKTATARVAGLKVAVDSIKRGFDEFHAAHPEKTLKDYLTGSDVQIVRDYADAQRHLNEGANQHGDLLTKIHDKEVTRARGIEGLNELVKEGTIDQHEFTEAMKEFTETGTSPLMQEEIKLLKEFHGALQDVNLQLSAANDLRSKGKITAFEYLQTQNAANAAARVAAGTDFSESTTHGAQLPSFAMPSLDSLGPKLRTSQEQFVAGLTEDRGNVKLYLEEMEKVKEAKLPWDLQAQAVQKLRDKYNDLKSPIEEFAKGQQHLDDELRQHLITQEAYNRALDGLKLRLGQADWDTGIRQGFRDISEEAHGSAKEIEGAMKSAFDGVNENLTAMITGQQTNWAKLADSIEHDMVKASLHKLEASAIDSVSGDAAQGATLAAAMATGGLTAGGEISSAMTLAGGAVAEMIGAAMTAGGTASAAGGASAAALGGAADGADFTIPHFANGGTLTPMRSGRDDHLLQMFVRTGERVQVQTPEQQAAASAGQGQASSEPSVRIVNNYQDDHRAYTEHLASTEGERVIMNTVMRNRRMLR